MNTTLVTGGAGYIGSHGARQRNAHGERSRMPDCRTTGFRNAVRADELITVRTALPWEQKRVHHPYH